MNISSPKIDRVLALLPERRSMWTTRLAANAEVDPATGCLIWNGYTSGGYGRLWIDGAAILAHRLAWAVHHNQNPGDRLVCHRCDTPRCINPDHLFLGTLTDNNRDRHRKGRSVMPECIGSRHGMSKLNERDVARIKAMRRQGMTGPAIAEHFDVSKWAIFSIFQGRTWSHVE